jgi:uncharacterized caspase-like protein
MKLYGVFVGVDTYLDGRITPLRFARTDAELFYDTVKQGIDAQERDIRLITDENAKKSAIVKTIGEEFSRIVNEDDIVLLYFACHGSPEMAGSIDRVSRYLILHDTEYERIYSTGLELETELQRICFHRLRAKLIVVFIDACFSGRAGGRTFEGPQIFRNRQESGTRATVRLRDFEPGDGRIILAAADDTEVAREYPTLQHGVFTYYLVRALSSTPAVGDAISISSLYDDVSQQVHQHTDGRQNPVLIGRTKLGRLPLFRPPTNADLKT